jgi:transcriptional regulator with GAF, ATPase, and Fis domain
MRQALERADGVQTQAAELLGMTFRSFRYYAKKAGLTGSDKDD